MVNTKPSILIVDDEKAICNLLYKELIERGYQCSTALDGRDALIQLAAQDFDVVLLDIKLRGMSGIEVLRKISSVSKKTAAIMVTVVNNIDTVVEAMKLGAADYIVKPFDLDKINGRIQMLLNSEECLPERRDYQTHLYLDGEEEDEPATEDPHSGRMNAIAYGVEARLDLLLGFSKIVTQETIEIAQQLDIPEKEIQIWVNARSRLDSEINRIIEHLLDKLERNPLAQKILGMLVTYLSTPGSKESEN